MKRRAATTSLSNLDIGSGRILADSAKQTLAIDTLSIAAKGKTGADAFELKLDAPKLQVSPDKSGGETLSLSATLAGSGRNVAAKLVLSGVEGNAKALKIGKLALDLDAKAGETTARGRLESPVAADLAAQTLALEKLAGKHRPRQPADADEAAFTAHRRQVARRPGEAEAPRWNWVRSSTNRRSR
jgi:AsmA protein